MGAEVASNENDIAEYNKKHEKLKAKSKFGGSRQQLSKARSQYDIHRAQLESYSDDSISNDTYGRIEAAKIELDGINESIDKITSALSARRSKCTFRSIAEVEQASAKLDSLKDKLQETIIEENPHIETYTKMEELLVQLQAQDDKTEKLNELDTTLKHQEFLLKLLTKKDSFLRKNLLDRSLPFLNKRLMGYLEKLGLPHRVEFQPDMSAHISQFGTELDFSSLSSGQKARVNLALAFAFRDVLQARHGKISFCMLDECLDHGLGNVGVQLAAKMIKQIATEENMSMFVISHRDEVTNMFPRQMVVELKNGFSTITSQ
jgi:DNA repair exonuclease SbcCD ATPase subunit